MELFGVLALIKVRQNNGESLTASWMYFWQCETADGEMDAFQAEVLAQFQFQYREKTLLIANFCNFGHITIRLHAPNG